MPVLRTWEPQFPSNRFQIPLLFTHHSPDGLLPDNPVAVRSKHPAERPRNHMLPRGSRGNYTAPLVPTRFYPPPPGRARRRRPYGSFLSDALLTRPPPPIGSPISLLLRLPGYGVYLFRTAASVPSGFFRGDYMQGPAAEGPARRSCLPPLRVRQGRRVSIRGRVASVEAHLPSPA